MKKITEKQKKNIVKTINKKTQKKQRKYQYLNKNKY